MIEKYGQDNASKIQEFKDKKKETFIKNYSMKNIFCDFMLKHRREICCHEIMQSGQLS